MKVFEFAKEIGLETISLMDKIREWKLPVKSHMATLDPIMMDEIKAKLSEETSAKSVKTKAVKKTAAKKTAAASTEIAKPVKSSAESSKEKEKEKVKEKAAKTTTKKVSTIVSRPEVLAPKAALKKETAKVEAKADASDESTEAKPAAKVVAKTGGVIRRKAGELPPPPAIVTRAEAAAQAAADEAAAAEAAATGGEVPVGTPPAVSAAAPGSLTPDGKKRNIVGRMDLSRAKAPPGAAGAGRPQDGTMRPGGATAARGNIRTGFFAQGPVFETPVVDAEEERKREEKKKRPGATREEPPQVFLASDFRKREVIFQPKKKKIAVGRDIKKTQLTTPKASKRIVHVNKTMSVNELALALGVKAPVLMKKLMASGVMASITQQLDFDTIALIAPEFNFEAENVYRTTEQILDSAAFGNVDAEVVFRPPVVTVMGHVDHGKTSLLDAIRQANVAAKEAGGITQHIGAYKVQLENGKWITFLDTPGHEAFTAMRARGANVTDIAIIVVAADDGVMPQTAEAISHAKSAGVPIIIAVNKIDKPGADVGKIKQQLTEFQIVPEEWGGANIFAEVSALKKTGIKELLEQILLVAEVEDLKANPERSGTSIVIESRVDKGRGPVATVLVKDGHISVGDNIVSGTAAGRVRAMTNYLGEPVKMAMPGDPVEILGLPAAVNAGDRLDVVENEDMARSVVEARKLELEKPKAVGKEGVTLEELFAKIQKGQAHELNVIVKTDVSGSVEALRGMLEKAATPEVKVKIIHSNVGGITESDVLLASTAGAIILGFNVRPDTSALRMAKDRQVDVRTYTIIYELLDDVKKAMVGMLKPVTKEVATGRAEVREVFSVPKAGNIGGCSVIDGKITRSDLCRVLRNGTIVYSGKFASLRRFKDDVREVATGFECGIGIENFNDIKAGDLIESYVIQTVAAQL